MSVHDDMTAVVQLACLTEDRTDAEQRALLRVARRIDEDYNANTVGSPAWDHGGSVTARPVRRLSTLERLAEGSRVLDDRQREVRLKQKDTPAGRHHLAQCNHLEGGCGFPVAHPIHSGQG